MPTIHPFHLAFSGGLHLGARGINLEESSAAVPADTLFSALVATWRLMGYDPPTLVERAQQAPPFLLTSAFPRVGNVRFYPMPVDPAVLFTPSGWQTIRQRGKAIKRLRYLSEGLVRRWLVDQQPLDDALFDEQGNAAQGVSLQHDTLWLSKEEVEHLPPAFRFLDKAQRRKRPLEALRYLPVWTHHRIPRVTIDRIRSASNIYHVGAVRFAEGCGLWFGIVWQNADMPVSEAEDGQTFRELVRSALDLLQTNGLGGERSSGYGQFTLSEASPVSLPDAKEGMRAWLLSRYLPQTAELEAGALADRETAYAITTVRGWVHTLDAPDQRRKSLVMVSEGSLVCATGALMGAVANVQPTYGANDGTPGIPHPVYRYGVAVALGVPPHKEGSHG